MDEEIVKTAESPPDVEEAGGGDETQDFQEDERQYRMPVDPGTKKRHFRFVVYPESAPADWLEQMENTGLPFVVSPLHDKDVYSTGEIKKPHYHMIVSYPNTTTYRSVVGLRQITHGPYPLLCNHVPGAYAYLTHKHNPEKYQYDPQEIRAYNGWMVTLTSADIRRAMNDIDDLVYADMITEYGELVPAARELGGDDFTNVVETHTHHYTALVNSLRHNPYKVLARQIRALQARMTNSNDENCRDLYNRTVKQFETLEGADYDND